MYSQVIFNIYVNRVLCTHLSVCMWVGVHVCRACAVKYVDKNPIHQQVSEQLLRHYWQLVIGAETDLGVNFSNLINIQTRTGAMADDAPPAFFCPISMELMRDPVSTADGHCYERASIERWFAQGSRTSPKTGASLSSITVIPS